MDHIIHLREQLHRHPELGNHEVETSRIVEQALRSFGLETERILDTAIVATLRGGQPGKTVALRADMDALPLTENTGYAFSSQNEGVMHACGHDVHMAAALGAAKLLSQKRDQLHGTVKFFFQPDEEGDGGAQRMVDAGCMDGVDAVFGAHVDPKLPAGVIGIRYGKFYAAADVFDITVHGKSAHGAMPEKGIDALYAASQLICRLHALHSEYPDERYVLTVGTMQAGTARNILSDHAAFSGILRTLGPEMRSAMKQRICEVAAQVEAETGTNIEVTLRPSYPGVVNHNEMSAFVLDVAKGRFGAGSVQILPDPTMTTEDFGYFLDKAQGCFYHIGVGGQYPLHHPCFLPDNHAVLTAASLHAAVLESYLLQA